MRMKSMNYDELKDFNIFQPHWTPIYSSDFGDPMFQPVFQVLNPMLATMTVFVLPPKESCGGSSLGE